MSTLDDQLANEKLMLNLGRDRVRAVSSRRKANNMESLSEYGESLCSFGVQNIIYHLRAVRKKIEKGRAGQNYALLTPLLDLDPSQIAAASIRSVVDSLSMTPTLHQVSSNVIEKIWIETMLDRATDNELSKYKRGRHKKRYRIFLINNMINTEQWTSRQRMASGLFMVELIQKYTGLIEIVLDKSTTPPKRIVRATQDCMNWIKDVDEKLKLMSPNFLPMLVEPRQFTTPYDGGYITKPARYNLFKSNNEILAKNMKGNEPYLDAVNIQGKVAWQVNRYILDQSLYAYDNNLEIGCLLPRDGYSVPPYPKHCEPDSQEVLQWRINCKNIIDKNNYTQGSRIGIAKTFWMAKKFKDAKQLYFPKQLDFRGRIYDRVPSLNSQGNDLSRALLQFAKGKLIKTEEDLNWLKIHGANMYGIKSDFKTRIQWVNENINLIYGAGRDCGSQPEFWMRGSKAWSFLAFCRSIYLYSQEPGSYLCQLPCHLDCTCSSIQHFSGLLRSKVMGEKVNLINSEQPQDIYSEVAQAVNNELRMNDEEVNRKWLMLSPDRSLAKPCVMTAPYAATNSAFYHFAYSWANEKMMTTLGKGKHNWLRKPLAKSTVGYMAQLLYKHSCQAIKPAVGAMKFFRHIGRELGKDNKGVQWHSPSGLLVHQKYLDQKKSRIQLKYLSDVYLDIRTNVDTQEVDTRKMALAISANILHSFDASHMALSTIHASIEGVENIAGIHDCFVTTPSEMSELRNSVRQTFADMYSENCLSKLKAELKAQLTDNQIKHLPSEPTLGELDVEQTRTSTYFVT